MQEEWKAMSEQQLQRIREKHSEEISSLDQAETELRNKLVLLQAHPWMANKWL